MKFFTLAVYAFLFVLVAWTNGQSQSNSTLSAGAVVSYEPSTATDPKAPPHVAPIHTTHPEVFSGISGSGHPVVGDGDGYYYMSGSSGDNIWDITWQVIEPVEGRFDFSSVHDCIGRGPQPHIFEVEDTGETLKIVKELTSPEP